MSTRNKRSTKAVNYSTLENGLYSDDDFTDFTPPSKEKKEKSKNRDKNKENKANSINSKAEVNCNRESVSHKNSPKPRLTLEERKFQRDLQQAIEKSAPNRPKESFQGADDNTENVVSEPAPSLRMSIAEAEVHSLPESEEETVEARDVQERLQVPVEENEPMPGTSNGFTLKRPRKKVNFVEDDSDEWTDNEIKTADSDSNGSEFSPRPRKKKEKKSPKTKDSKTRKDATSVIKPLKTKHQTTSVAKTHTETVATARRPIPLASKNQGTSISAPKTAPINKEPIISYVPKPTASAHTSNSPSMELVKKPFKDPTVGSPSPNISSASPFIPSGIGLRLGLSRKRVVRSLHPNASVK